jgi:hypothetical protein
MAASFSRELGKSSRVPAGVDVPPVRDIGFYPDGTGERQ